VRSFPEGPVAIQVSQEGGTEPVWAPDGRTTVLPRCRWYAFVRGAGHGRRRVTVRRADQDGRALLMLAAPTHGRELKLILNFDEVIRLKMAETGQNVGEGGGRKWRNGGDTLVGRIVAPTRSLPAGRRGAASD